MRGSTAERASGGGDDVPPQTLGPANRALDDATLVARARDGDTGSFEELVGRYQAAMYRLAVRMLASRSDAEEVVQEVFLTAWRRLPELRADAAFVGWLYRSTTNRCLNVLRARRPSVELDPETTVSTTAEDQPERAAEIGSALAALTRALAHLTPPQRACWLLRELHGRSYEEIGQIVGANPTAVRGRISRARAELVEVMSPWR